MSGDFDDAEYEAQDERARASAHDTWKWALASGEDVDTCIAKARRRELEAQSRGHNDTARWWGVIGTTLYHRQKLNDEAICNAIEDVGLVDGVWPDDAGQALDWNLGPDL